jgi:thermitase
MKHSIKVIVFVFILIPVFLQPGNAQDSFVWLNGERVFLQVSSDRFILQVPDSVYHEVLDLSVLHHQPERNRYQKYNKKVIWITETTLNQMDVLRDEASVPIYISPVYKLENEGMKHTTGELLVRWKKELDSEHITELEKQYQLRRMEHLGETILYEYMPPYETTSLEAANALYESGHVQWANPNYSYAIKTLSHTPNDLLYSQQWNLPKIQANYAWDITIGDGAVVAIFDDGVDLFHDDIQDNLLLDGANNVVGFNATDRGAPNDPHPDGQDAHGTAVAGIAAAVTNNNEGIAGIAADGRIMPLQMGYAHPIWGPDFIETEPNWWIDCLDFAVNNGADVVNMSVGLGQDNDFDNVMDNAVNNGVILVAASGNNGATAIAYPASNANVIAVGATLQNDTRWSNSNYDANLDLVAPGGAPIIWTTDRPGNIGFTNEDYLEFGGTSAAAPHVAAAAGLMRSVDINLTPAQIRTILHNTADWSGHMGGSPPTDEYGHGRLNAYEAVKAAMPQFTNHSFTSSTTITEYMYLNGNTTLADGATLTIPEGLGVVVDGSLSSTGSISTIVVEGNLVVEQNSSLNYIKLVVEEDGHLATRSGVTLDAATEVFTVYGSARMGSSFTMLDGNILIAEGGHMEFLGSADLQFIETAAFPPLYQGLFFQVHGKIVFSGNQTVQARQSSNSTAPAWNGITLYHHSSGSTLQGLLIEDTGIGINLSSTSDVTLQDIEIQSPASRGIFSTSSEFNAKNVTVTGDYDWGIDVMGGISKFNHVTLSGSTYGGLRIRQYATSSNVESSIDGSGYTGVSIESASHDHINGIVGPNNVYDVRAIEDAYGFFNGTTWGGSGGQPSTYQDGSSTLIIQNPNNPLRAGDGQKLAMNSHQTIRSQGELLQEWSERYRQDSGQAEAWLHQIQAELPDKLNDVASILLLDHYLARGEFDAADLLADSADPGRMEAHLAPGAFALRTLQLALHGPADEPLARQSLEQVRESGLEEFLVDRLAFMVEERYGMEDDSGWMMATEERITITEPKLGNYPNPFNPTTVIHYHLPAASDVRLEVFDVVGRRVATLVEGVHEAGEYQVMFDGSRLSSGVYIYRFQAGDFVQSRKLTLIK